MQLSDRLNSVAEFVTKKNRVADVGCDHAYTSIYLVEKGISPKVIAMDVNKGPILRAKENVHKYGYDNQIDVRLSDGLTALQEDEVDTILIAGMGGSLMVRILTARTEVLAKVKELVLQPQSEIYKVRMMLQQYGFAITQENMLIDEGKYYVMMKAEKVGLNNEYELYKLYRDEHFHFGRLLLENKNSILKEFLEKEHNQCIHISERLRSEATEKSMERWNEIKEKMELIRKGLDYYD
ncbi:MAG: hypothetical protein K0S47_2453 [Herbinix sp.]|jgi:tRNA (adenine22-N1)-methyltransferase|nr:hypothetical protein [Herbinix sp.]